MRAPGPVHNGLSRVGLARVVAVNVGQPRRRFPRSQIQASVLQVVAGTLGAVAPIVALVLLAKFRITLADLQAFEQGGVVEGA